VGDTFPDDISESITYHLENQIKSSSARLDENGTVIDREEYYPFGDSSLRTFSQKRYRYVGKEKDLESGLYYYGARYYSAWTCRFISVDPLAGKYAHLSSFNYASNSPLGEMDIDGMQNPSEAGSKQGNNGSDNNSSNQPPIDSSQKSDTTLTETDVTDVSTEYKISKSTLEEMFPKGDSDVLQSLADNLNAHMEDFGVDNDYELAHFLAQAAHETGGFKKSSVTESLNYSVEGLLSTFGKYFVKEVPKVKEEGVTYNVAGDYGRKEGQAAKQEDIANIVYGQRMGNEGEGYKYRGRGIFQLTGKDNYQAFTDYYQENVDSTKDFVDNPDLIASDSEIALISALWHYEQNVLNNMTVDVNTTVLSVTLKVNGGKIGLKEREDLFNSIKSVFKF